MATAGKGPNLFSPRPGSIGSGDLLRVVGSRRRSPLGTDAVVEVAKMLADLVKQRRLGLE
jgi:hypothetical protein